MSTQYPAYAGVVDAIVFNRLLLPGQSFKTLPFVVAGGQTLPAGAVMGLVSATGKLVLSLAAAGDGSQNPVAILTANISTFAADGTTPLDFGAPAYVEGMFNETILFFGLGHSIATVRAPLRALGIYTRAPGYSG